ncbi:MAG: ABC transporter ATP-binding protein [Planctomycetaceae bacterium]
MSTTMAAPRETMPVTSQAIEVDHLSCWFRQGEALHDVCLSIPVGSVFGLVGLNGAGKTTLIRHLIGGLRPQRGRVRVLGEDPAAVPEVVLNRIGYVAEEDALPRWMTVGELIDFMRALYKGWDDQHCHDLMEMFGLSRSQRLADLSKGGRARAGLLIAIAHRPELLILDEPSYGLDPIARQDILEAIVRTASDEGRTVLFSSHLLDEVARVCDTVAVLCEGRLLESISMESLPERYAEAIVDGEFASLPGGGLFGWQHRGREWSVAIDRTIYPNDEAIHKVLSTANVRQLRPISLERWFQARVAESDLAAGMTLAGATP